MPKEIIRKVNNFVGEKLKMACDTVIGITNAVTESFAPLEKHELGIVVRFTQEQKNLFEKRRALRERFLA